MRDRDRAEAKLRSQQIVARLRTGEPGGQGVLRQGFEILARNGQEIFGDFPVVESSRANAVDGRVTGGTFVAEVALGGHVFGVGARGQHQTLGACERGDTGAYPRLVDEFDDARFGGGEADWRNRRGRSVREESMEAGGDRQNQDGSADRERIVELSAAVARQRNRGH